MGHNDAAESTDVAATNGLTIRRAGVEDAAAVHALIVALAEYEREPDAVELTPQQLASQLADENPPFQCLLAERDGHTCGFALYFQSYSTWRGRPGLYLEDLFVPPEHRGRGVGKALLAQLARMAVSQGCARVEWSVLDWNKPAIDFYRALGAQPMSGWTVYRLCDAPLLRLADAAQ